MCSRLASVRSPTPSHRQVPGKCVGRLVPQLPREPIDHLSRTTYEPVTKPLIRHVGAHSIVGRRCNNPADPFSPWKKTSDARGSTVSPHDVCFHCGWQMGEVIGSFSRHELQHIYFGWLQASFLPKRSRIPVSLPRLILRPDQSIQSFAD